MARPCPVIPLESLTCVLFNFMSQSYIVVWIMHAYAPFYISGLDSSFYGDTVPMFDRIHIRCEQYISADKSTYFIQRRPAVAERQLPPRFPPTFQFPHYSIVAQWPFCHGLRPNWIDPVWSMNAN